MTPAESVAVVLWLGTMTYAIFGGADFGAGLWDLLAGNDRRGAAQRELIDRAVGPVWEANHTWLIFDLVILWSAFPGAFAAITSTLYLPLALAAVGIVLRGAGFAFRKVSLRLTGRRAFGLTFALSSVVTPFFLGTVLGGIASGRVPPEGRRRPARQLAQPDIDLAIGLLAVAAGAYIAAAFLTADATSKRPEPRGRVPPADIRPRDRRRRPRDRGPARAAGRRAAPVRGTDGIRPAVRRSLRRRGLGESRPLLCRRRPLDARPSPWSRSRRSFSAGASPSTRSCSHRT